MFGKNLHFALIFERYFRWIQNSDLTNFFSFSSLKDVTPLSSACLISDKKYILLPTSVLCVNISFSPATFRNFPLALGFSSLIKMCPVEFSLYYIVWTLWTSWICGLLSFANFENYIFRYSCCPVLCLLSFWYMYIRLFDIVPNLLDGLCFIFLTRFFFCDG